MNIILMIIMIFLILLFIILPMNIKIIETHEIGNAKSAPENPKIKQKLILSLILAIIITAISFYIKSHYEY